MYNKIKALLHALAVITIFFFTDSFCQQLMKMAVRLCSFTSFLVVLHVFLDILNVWIAVFLYSKYVLRMSLSELHMGKPLPALRWYMAAAVIPILIDVIYFAFTSGEFQIGCHSMNDLIDILIHEVFSSGFRAAVTEGMLFRGLMSAAVQKGFGYKAGILVSSFFYAAVSFIFYNGFVWSGPYCFGKFLLTFLIGMALILITCETGSVWASVVIHFLYNALSGDAYILHISTRQDFPAVFTYTVKGKDAFFAEMSLPAAAVFSAVIIMEAVTLKKRGMLWEKQID